MERSGRLLFYVSLVTIVSCLICAGWVYTIDSRFRAYNPRVFFDQPQRKIWSHRGFARHNPENSLESIQAAFDSGAPGVEIDIHYVKDTDRFAVAHDWGHKETTGDFLSLEDVLQQSSSSGYFWLDFKNLSYLSKDESKRAMVAMERLLEQYKLWEKVIIESTDDASLAIFANRDFFTSYWISLPKQGNSIYRWIRLLRCKQNIANNSFSAISMHYDLYVMYKEHFAHLPAHLFTINNPNVLRDFVSNPSVKIILTDQDYFGLDQQ